MTAAVIEIIIEVVVEAGEIGAEVAVESAAAAEAAAIDSEVATSEIVTEEVASVLEGSIEGMVDETVSEEVSAEIDTEIDAEVESEVESEIDETGSGKSTSSTPTYKIILKWVNRIALAYTLIDTIGKKIYNLLHSSPSDQKPSLTKEEEQDLHNLQEATTDMEWVFDEMMKTMKVLKSEDLGTISAGDGNKPVYVSDVLDGLLAQVQTVSCGILICV